MHDDFAMEPIQGLPGKLPAGERILWQGRPDWWALAKSALAFQWVCGYFLLLAGWQLLSAADHTPFPQAIPTTFPVLFFGLVAAGLLLITAYIQARATVYTLTNRRIVMRVGAALTMTLNLPFTEIGRADLDLRRDGTGTISLTPMGKMRFGYLILWPHVRPWDFRTKPSLRCIADARSVAGLIAETAARHIEVSGTRTGNHDISTRVMALEPAGVAGAAALSGTIPPSLAVSGS